ncbi:MAG: hypothetical protein ACYDBW_03220 [Sulfuricaulis sp.]
MKSKNTKAGYRLVGQIILLGGALLLLDRSAYALNYFELETYPYRTASQGEVELENFTAYTRRGSQDAPVPDNNQGLVRNSMEMTYGVTDKTEVAGYLDYARARSAGDWNLEGSRVHVRTRFAEKGEWPVDLGLYAEAGFPHNDANDIEFELRGIIEKDLGKWTLDVNPIFERVVKGADKSVGWELQYAASVIYRLNERWHPRLDFFGDFGQLRNFEGRSQQKHLISPAVDIILGRGLSASIGVAFGQTRASEQQVVRARIEWEFR